mmetsp:Transcript_11758/g.27230  ORF Transcript_11758/g.27230 Transcript_11758/m.27230 type:complete len:230 (-) Transcript_11758:230-919(-)
MKEEVIPNMPIMLLLPSLAEYQFHDSRTSGKEKEYAGPGREVVRVSIRSHKGTEWMGDGKEDGKRVFRFDIKRDNHGQDTDHQGILHILPHGNIRKAKTKDHQTEHKGIRKVLHKAHECASSCAWHDTIHAGNVLMHKAMEEGGSGHATVEQEIIHLKSKLVHVPEVQPHNHDGHGSIHPPRHLVRILPEAIFGATIIEISHGRSRPHTEPLQHSLAKWEPTLSSSNEQ